MQQESQILASQLKVTTSQLKVLIVDDSNLIRSLLRFVLEKDYQVCEADNGAAGLKIASDWIPDLIITDLMMPELDGYQMIMALREKEKTAHIPAIMLTTVDTEFNELEAYRIGADAYLLKPFTKDQMMVRVESLLKNRNLAYHVLNTNFSGFDNVNNAADPSANFKEHMTRYLESEFNNAGLKVKHIATSMGMSVSTFERRVKENYTTTPKLYIRDYRLNHAMVLLKARRNNVSGVARECGFDNISYFSLCFREKFGFSPSEVLHIQASA